MDTESVVAVMIAGSAGALLTALLLGGAFWLWQRRSGPGRHQHLSSSNAGSAGAGGADAISRRELVGAMFGVSAVSAAATAALHPRQAHAAMAVFDATSFARAGEMLSQAVKHAELLTDLARLDQMAVKALGELGLPEGVAGGLSGLFSVMDTGQKIFGLSKRVEKLGPRLERNLGQGIQGLGNMKESLSTPEGTRRTINGIYQLEEGRKRGGYGGREAAAFERAWENSAVLTAADAMTVAVSQREDVTVNGPERITELSALAEAAGASSESGGGSMRAQLTSVNATLLAILEELQAQRLVMAADLQARQAYMLGQRRLQNTAPEAEDDLPDLVLHPSGGSDGPTGGGSDPIQWFDNP